MTLERMQYIRDVVGYRLFKRLEDLGANTDPRFDEELIWGLHYELKEHIRLSAPFSARWFLPMRNEMFNLIRLEHLAHNLYWKILVANFDNHVILLILKSIDSVLNNFFPYLHMSDNLRRNLRLYIQAFIDKADNTNVTLVGIQARDLLDVIMRLECRSRVPIIDLMTFDTLQSMAVQRHPNHKFIMSKI